MQVEFDTLVKNQKWMLIPKSDVDNIINMKWMFHVKQKSDWSVEWFKARWVENGMKQIEGNDYTQTFNLVVKANSMCLMLTVTVSRDWKLSQIDISNVFLHGTLDERIMITQPAGFEDSKFSNHVCLLQKSLYGLRQSLWMWYRQLKEFLLKIGFKESVNNPLLFIILQQHDIVYLFAYVDNIHAYGIVGIFSFRGHCKIEARIFARRVRRFDVLLGYPSLEDDGETTSITTIIPRQFIG